jgi:hypothetical protein
VTKFDKPVPKSLDAITDLVLAFRSLPKSESAKKRVKKAESIEKVGSPAMSPQVEKWLVDHVKGLHVRTKHGNAIYSGMLIRLGGDPYFLTAGHCLEQLDKARKDGIKIEEAHFLPTDGSPAFSILDIEQTPLHYLHEEGSMDIGLLPLRKWYENQLGDEVFLEEKHFTDLPPEYTGCMLVGFPAEFEAFQQTTISLNPVFISVTPIPKPVTLPEVNPPRFYGNIPHFDFDIAGTSGGPIMGFWHDEERGEVKYWIVALQSGWYNGDRLICGTYVSTCLPILLERIGSQHK